MPVSNAILFLLIIYFLIIVAFSMLKSRYLPGRAIYLLRAFFPSWKFFEDFGEVPILFCRTCSKGEEFGPWQLCLEKSKRQLSSFILNPHGNFLLACGSLLQQLVSDLEDTDDTKVKEFENSVSYQLVKNLVRYQILKNGISSEGLRFQFKVGMALPESPEHKIDDMLISPVYEV